MEADMKKRLYIHIVLLILAAFLLVFTGCEQAHIGYDDNRTSTDSETPFDPGTDGGGEENPPVAGTITFHANGGEGTMEPVTGLEEGYEIQLPANTFTKTGCRFVGWSVENDNDPEYSDRFVNVTFYASYNSNLYAVWEDETTALTVTFTANGGSGSIDPIYGRKGQKVHLPGNNFTAPSDDKEFYKWATAADGIPQYDPGQSFTMNADTVMYAIWELKDPAAGGFSEEFRNQTVLVKGVSVKESDWLTETVAGKDFVMAKWYDGCGWYDIYQENWDMCWAATASNVLHWWFDQNKEYIDRFGDKYTGPEPKYTVGGVSSFPVSSFFELFKKAWPNAGNHPYIGFAWFIGYNDETSSAYENVRQEGRFFAEVFEGSMLHEKVVGTVNRRTFNMFVAEALKSGKMLSIHQRTGLGAGHAVSLWGAEFDGDGYIKRVYITDSSTSSNNTFNAEVGLLRMDVSYDPDDGAVDFVSYMGGTRRVVNVESYSLGTEYWDAYFAK